MYFGDYEYSDELLQSIILYLKHLFWFLSKCILSETSVANLNQLKCTFPETYIKVICRAEDVLTELKWKSKMQF